jgi:wobble nucleotide-excising tRNase
MLEEVYIANIGSYSMDVQRLSGCKSVNFIFGTNGSGKTTISRVIGSPAEFTDCGLVWVAGQPKERLVFNSDFAARNFSSKMPGIFTLGEESAEIQSKIQELKDKRSAYERDVRNRRILLLGPDGTSGKHQELADLRAAFEQTCWGIKNAHDEHFKDVFEGLRSSKTRFCDKILSEFSANTADVESLDVLKTRASTVFKKGQQPVNLLTLPMFDDLIALENRQILSKKIVGKEDIDVGALINRLSNSDWVQIGRSYLANSGDQCPFCQQRLLIDIREQLDQYFDETYVADLNDLLALQHEYQEVSSRIIEVLNGILSLENSFLDNQALQLQVQILSQKISGNETTIAAKRKEPSRASKLDEILECTNAIADIINLANSKIAAHNKLVENLISERSKLVDQAWKCILENEKINIDIYIDKKKKVDGAINGLEAGIATKEQEARNVTREIEALERSITSSIPTVNAINSTLASFGFTGFKLATAEEDNTQYTVVRADGTDATPTLSEGEKSFITFLYFYHLIKGSLQASGLTEERIVVIDDPVSSLDSDVLFIVSTLIKDILKEAIDGTGQIRQVFVLTHNIYFHKEVTFDPDRRTDTRRHKNFWIVRKREGRSTFERYDHNPIKTSYELLWSEVKNPNRSLMTIQNTLRRILENYFKILGNLDKDDIIEKFDGREKQICGSLFSWVNDGSHAVHDDLYISADQEVVERHLRVFKAIFEKTGHENHYNMMMGVESIVASATTSANVVANPGAATVAE